MVELVPSYSVVFRIFTIVVIAAVPLQATDSPVDFAVVLTPTDIFESLETYAARLDRVEAGSFYPVLSVIEDQYGIHWAEVELPDEKTGFLTDFVIVRKSGAQLEKVLERVDFADIEDWSEGFFWIARKMNVEVGFSASRLLLSAGIPLRERSVGPLTEWIYPRHSILMRDGKVTAYTSVQRLPLDKSVSIEISHDDVEYSTVSGQWQAIDIDNFSYVKSEDGIGKARIQISLPTVGAYRVSAQWRAETGNSAKVSYRILQKRRQIAEFVANQRLYDKQWVWLGDLRLSDSAPLIVEILAEDGGSFNFNALLIEFINDPFIAVGRGDGLAQ